MNETPIFPRLSKKLFGEDYAAIKKSNYPLQYFPSVPFAIPSVCTSDQNSIRNTGKHPMWSDSPITLVVEFT